MFELLSVCLLSLPSFVFAILAATVASIPLVPVSVAVARET